MPLLPFLQKLRNRENLNESEASAAMKLLFSGQTPESELEEYLVLLADKGETPEEIAGSAKIMQAHANIIAPKVKNKIVDIVGTGGDKSNSFNISTTAAFVIAGAGVPVAKHGNKAVSSKSGAANVLEALGVKIDLPPEKVQQEIETVGIGFLFAPMFHPAMKYAAPIRAKLGRRTIFNLLGPLTNPAQAKNIVIGVFDPKLVPVYADVLKKMNCEHALVVHGDGLDELTNAGKNLALELRSGEISEIEIDLDELGIKQGKLSDLIGGEAKENAEITRRILNNTETGPKREIVLLNAGAAIYAADAAPTLRQGVELARQSLEYGAAEEKLNQMIEFSKNV